MRLLLILLLALWPGTAIAGLRATFAVTMGPPVLVEIADNGDISADLGNGQSLLVLGDEEYLVVERLTGPLVMRLGDLLVEATGQFDAGLQNIEFDIQLVERGMMEVNGRTGRAWYVNTARSLPGAPPVAVLSSDSALAPLSRAIRHMVAAQQALAVRGNPAGMNGGLAALVGLLDKGAPLRFGAWALRSVEYAAIPAERFTLPAPAETREAMRARIAAEAAANEGSNRANMMITHAQFAGSRLWMVDDKGALFSLAESETARTAHDLGGRVAALCRSGRSLLALTIAEGDNAWTLRRLDVGTWRTVREIDRSGDNFVAMACGEAGDVILTNRRLLDLASGSRSLPIRGTLRPARVRTILHVTPDAVFAGLNSGEWGGGLSRIDRRTGVVTVLERNATGESCDGPLNTDCDPVNGLAALPWRRDCLAAAIGLMHMMAHGRIVSVCGNNIEQVFVGLADVDPENARDMAEATTGGYGSAAFFGLAPAGDGLVAAGHNGLYRITGPNTGTHHPWPRFVEVDGILVSFALPDVVLVMSELNRRASMSGLAPILVPR